MATETLRNVENYIRDLAKDKRCRLSENFLDFDHLRSGYVTTGRFFRILRNLIGITLKPEAETLIMNKYGSDENREINWRRFVEDIEGKFDSADFSQHPDCKVLKTIDSQYVGTKAPHRKPGDDQLDNLRPILSRINQFITYQGYNIRECYKQFDVHNMGVVTESQFYRSFPGPKDISDTELTILAERYRSLTHPGLVDYLAFEKELNDSTAAEEVSRIGDLSENADATQTHIPEPMEDHLRPSLNMLIDRICFAAHRRGIRVMDFFADYDKLKHDAITEHQFVCALLLAIGKEAELTREEVQMLMNNYRSSKYPGLIAYRDLCRRIDSAFHILNLEKDPCIEPETLPSGKLATSVPTFSTEEEQRISQLLDEIRSKVRKNRITTYSHFRDYDLGTGISRVITNSQFARVLHFLGLDVTSEDCSRLCRKFSDPTSGQVNYAIFCQAVDEGFTAQRDHNQPSEEPYLNNCSCGNDLKPPEIGDSKSGRKVSRRDWLSTVVPCIKNAGDNLPVEVLVDRIRHLVLIHRIPLKTWFFDFDQLRTGHITRSQFTRCLTAAGFSRLGLHDLTPLQMNTISNAYVSPHDPNMVNWMKFVNDIDSVFTLPDLEKQPLTRVLPQETYKQPKPGTVDWSNASEEMRENYENSMSILRRKIHERRMILLPDFLAFDKSHRGYVSLNNFRQLVTMFDFSISPAGIDAIIARHANDDGFDYHSFLAVLDPRSPDDIKYCYPERLEVLKKTNILGKQRKEMEPIIRDTEGVLDELKAEVYRRRIRLSDWFRDHDKLNHGYMPRATFRRCLGVLPLTLGETALSMIEDCYKGPQPESIDWRKFCAEIEHVFQTPNLEKDPLIEPDVYLPDSIVAQNHLSVEDAKVADSAIVKIADKVSSCTRFI
ncbi:uncharacterized protein DEA37_0006198 [Paragonimus westermani]|uniref:EF-hand calcium-binding domain-containing protein 6 n=1 Tax=Paragonimus westermani TaxID=34504 RepID=A0A5J4NGX7_9TREM|nr:uncharacterized protein DEA37_0006198 [Paragonimus westermani]